MEQEYKYMVCTRCITFNHATYITDAMNGFTMQETTFPVITLIVDDASTDGEPDVIKHYLADHFQTPYRTEETEDYHLICATHKTNPNCTFVVFLLKYNHYSIKKNKTQYYKSEWIEKAKYCAFCEGDDYWIHPKKLQMQVDVLEKNIDCTMCHTSYMAYFDKIGRLVKSKDVLTNKPIQNASDVFRGYRTRFLTIIFRTKSYLEALSADPFFFSRAFMMGDGQIVYEMAQRGHIIFIPEVMCVYRVHEGSASRQRLKMSVRFALSCAEMQLYAASRDKNPDINFFIERYELALKNYLLFEPDYKVMFNYENVPEIQPLPSWKRFIKRQKFIIKFYIGKKIGLLQKYFIKYY